MRYARISGPERRSNWEWLSAGARIGHVRVDTEVYLTALFEEPEVDRATWAVHMSGEVSSSMFIFEPDFSG
ncbi:hypothetical protein CSX11_16950 [Mycobacterium goodii]|nr:hypothetical protein CSX11_16950 [Mycolicibacterium goodii]